MWALLLAGVGAAVLARLLVSRQTLGPEIAADEFAYLSMARYFAQVGEIWNLGRAGTYSVAYSVIIAPAFRLSDDPATVFRIVVWINALLGGATVVAFEAVVRRLTHLRRPASIVVATAGACLPSLVVTANHAWSDNLAPLVYAIVLVLGFRLIEQPTVWRAVVLAGASIISYSVHGRFIPIIVVTVLLLFSLALRRDLRWREAGAVVLAALGGTILVQVFSKAIWNRVYEPGGQASRLNTLVDGVGDPLALIYSVLGQGWTMVVVTAGLAGFGALALTRAALRWARILFDRRRADQPEPGRPNLDDLGLSVGGLQLVYLLATAGGLLFVSVVFMVNQDRADHLIYGRYNDAFVAVLVMVGISSLVAARGTLRRRAIDAALVGALMVLSGSVLWWQRSQLLSGPRNSVTMLGLIAIERTGTAAFVNATRWGLLLLAVVTVVAVLPRRRIVVITLVLLLLLPIGMHRANRRYPRFDTGHAASVVEVRQFLHADDVIVVSRRREGGATFSGFYAKQMYLDEIRFERNAELDPWVFGDELILASQSATEALDAGYRVLWVDPYSTDALWVGEGSRKEALAAAGTLFDGDPLSPTTRDADVRVDASDIEFRDGHMTGSIWVLREGSGPWVAAVDKPDLDPVGRVRVRISVWSRACDCIVAQHHQNLPQSFVSASETDFRVVLDVELGELTSDHGVQVGMERAGQEWLGHVTIVEHE